MESIEKTHQKMTEQPVFRLLLSLCLPTVFAALLPPFVAVIEVWLAAKISAEACGALGIVFPIHALIQTIGFVFGTGSGSLVANALGKKNAEKAHLLAFGSLLFALVLSGILTLFGLLFCGPLLLFLGKNADILPFAKPYAVCLLAAAPLMCACFVLSNLLRAEGKTVRAMLGLAGGNLVSVLCAALFVLAFQSGVLGIGLSVPIGYGCAFIVLSFPYWRKRTLVPLSPVFEKRIFSAAKSAAVNGLPSLFRQGLTVSAVVLLNRAANNFGSPAIAALALSTRIFLLAYALPLGIGQGMIPAIGFNYASGNQRRTKRIFVVCVLVATALLSALALPVAIFPGTVLQWFGKNGAILSFGVPLLRAVCAVLPLHGLIAVTNLLLQALKQPLSASVLAAARQGFFFLPLVFLLPRFFGFFGVWLTQALADGLTFLLALFYAARFLKSKEKKRPG